ncbi:unnamed protein product, partial [Polarella glacialis]
MAKKVLPQGPTAILDQARESAVRQVVCPICFEALSILPEQVGALTFSGRRVEAALYHRDCVVGANGHLMFESETGSAVSPMTRESVDGFKLMPPLSDGTEWLAFVDWNSAGCLDIGKVAAAVAALLPVDEGRAASFVRAAFGREDGDNAPLDPQGLQTVLLPSLQKQLRRLVSAAPRPTVPEICRNSSEAQLISWFNHWDSQSRGALDVRDLKFAIMAAFYSALSASEEETKAAVSQAFLLEMGLRETGSVSRSEFLEILAPQLQCNLPVGDLSGQSTLALDLKRPLGLKLRNMKTNMERNVTLPSAGEALVGDLRKAAHRKFPVLLCGRLVQLYFMGRRLQDDTQALCKMRGIYEGSAVLFLPGPLIPMYPVQGRRDGE